MRLALLVGITVLISVNTWSQGCCSGGAGSPIAGGAATGVLLKNQVELSANYQFNQSSVFLAGDRDTVALFDKLSSNYLFIRADYGVSKKLTMSVAAGCFLDKTLTESSDRNPVTNELESGKLISSKGIGDLILFPRYDIYNKSKGANRTEIALGLGLKIPLGSHTDSNLVISSPIIGDIYTISPPTVQATNGAHDLMFYSFYLKSFNHGKFRVFSNALYVKKGFNSLGQKFGDYASLGLFFGCNFLKKFGVTAQVKGEIVDQMEAANNVDLLAYYNIYIESTGSKKVFFIPQISFTHKSLTLYTTSEIPLYQYLEGSQVGSQYQFTTGLNYRFLAKKPAEITLGKI